MEDVKWLGFEWDGEVRYASDYFGEMYEYAKKLISLGKAYVDDQTAEEIKQTRGDFSTPGINSPYRDRSVEENLKLFEEMKDGKYDDCLLYTSLHQSVRRWTLRWARLLMKA